VRLLLDAMYWPALADQLVARGHDVSAAVARAELAGLGDEDLFDAAQAERRAVVTENVGDYVPIVGAYAAAGRAHHGLVLVAASAYARDRANREATLGRMVTALDALLTGHPGEDAGSLVTWLRDP
jgi:hypothetical protein